MRRTFIIAVDFCAILLFADKLVVKDDQEWCMDVFDQFVLAGQSVTVGEAVVRKYRPVSAENNHIVLHIFSTDKDDCKVRSLKSFTLSYMMTYLHVPVHH